MPIHIHIYSSFLVCEIPYGCEAKFVYACGRDRVRACRAPKCAARRVRQRWRQRWRVNIKSVLNVLLQERAECLSRAS